MPSAPDVPSHFVHHTNGQKTRATTGHVDAPSHYVTALKYSGSSFQALTKSLPTHEGNLRQWTCLILLICCRNGSKYQPGCTKLAPLFDYNTSSQHLCMEADRMWILNELQQKSRKGHRKERISGRYSSLTPNNISERGFFYLRCSVEGWMSRWVDGWMERCMDVRLPDRRLKDSRASTRYGVSLLERNLLMGLRSVLLSEVVAINLN